VRITIDNFDGGGARDYTAALSAPLPGVAPLKITRSLDAAARCTGMLDVNATGLPVPARRARVVITNDGGVVLFTGSLATAPERIYAGVATTGSVYRLAFRAADDDTPSATFGDAFASAATHAFGDGDGTLHNAALEPASIRELATDITLSGEMEPTAYITESFLGDGTTSVFQLTQAPFHQTGTSQFLNDGFDQATINPRLWSVTDPGSFLSLTHAGLTMTGGNGFDGRTTVAVIDQVEIGGTLVIEVGSVALGPASDGVVCGLYSGAIERGNGFAGYNVRQSSGTTVVTPFVNGAEAGTPFTMLSGHRYTLRLRLHCPETVRVVQTYDAMVEGELRSFGGGAVAAPVSLVFEVQDLGASSNTPATVLYTGSLAGSPASCTFAPVNSVQLIGSIGYCRITQAGSAWVVTTTPDGTQTVRVSGAAGDGVDCTISPAGRITFYSGRIPIANELITVNYRGRRRSVARLEDAASAGGLPETAQWQGKVLRPAARTSQDCENAALAALSFATARSATVSGSYTVENPAGDIRPRDVLAIASTNRDGAQDTLKLIVRSVTIEDGHALPELTTWRIAFANDWADGLGVKLSGTVADDALLPGAAATSPGAVLANLPSLQVTSATATALQIDTGTEPPPGGGFEIRRRDWAFGPGIDQDLVLRSPVRSFSIPREAQVERYFVRMYDGSGTPVYSRFSSAVFNNLPVAS
jgi:hypothetical protein